MDDCCYAKMATSCQRESERESTTSSKSHTEEKTKTADEAEMNSCGVAPSLPWSLLRSFGRGKGEVRGIRSRVRRRPLKPPLPTIIMSNVPSRRYKMDLLQARHPAARWSSGRTSPSVAGSGSP
ncbi:uncharacterized protein LOC133549313 isoform X3 [Nerophis ophidion]|uniref:uncharacterized protein LOC133549313 isoform X3 n=1 Tax=Nerophis ophidion TaxID=159077 RepID=UPI002ADF4196|nr:uncharacterized protein LOC133549313 isoform X3 [Nerophis ophidion]